MFRVGESINPDVFTDLIALLVKKPLAMNPYRKKSGLGRSQCFGLVYQRCGAYGGSRQNFARMEVYREILTIASKILPHDFHYDAIQLNQNYVTEPHKDTGNRGESAIIGFGVYQGGDLTIEGCDVNIYNRLVFFDGSKLTHSTQPFSGDRFTLVYHSHKDRHSVVPLYKVLVQSDGRLALEEQMQGVTRVYNKNGDIIHASDGVVPAKVKSRPYLRFCIPMPTELRIIITPLTQQQEATRVPSDLSTEDVDEEPHS